MYGFAVTGLAPGAATTVGAAVAAPHGGVLVLPMVVHPLGFLLALAAGVAVAAGS